MTTPDSTTTGDYGSIVKSIIRVMQADFLNFDWLGGCFHVSPDFLRLAVMIIFVTALNTKSMF